MSVDNNDNCPRCGSKMELYEKSGLLLCNKCQYFINVRK